MNHIEADRLDTDLMYRFQYVCKFMNFGEEDIKMIKGSAGAIAPLVPVVVNAVYDKLYNFDITMAYFTKKNHGFQGSVEANIKDINVYNSAQIKFRKDMLSKYLVKLVTAEYDENFVKYLDWVGKIHTNKGGSKSINVEYVHVNALFGYVHDFLTQAICGLGLSAEDLKKTISAFTKLLWIQNDLFTRHYIPTKQEIAEAEQQNKKELAKATEAAKRSNNGQLLNYAVVVAVTAVTCAILFNSRP